MEASEEQFIVHCLDAKESKAWHEINDFLDKEKQDPSSDGIHSRRLKVTGRFRRGFSYYTIPENSSFQAKTTDNGRRVYRIAFPDSYCVPEADGLLEKWIDYCNSPESLYLTAWTLQQFFPDATDFEAEKWENEPQFWEGHEGWNSDYGSTTRTLKRTIRIRRDNLPEVYTVPKGSKFSRRGYAEFKVEPPPGQDITGSDAGKERMQQYHIDNRLNNFTLFGFTDGAYFPEEPNTSNTADSAS